MSSLRIESLVIAPQIGQHPEYELIVSPETRVFAFGESHFNAQSKQTVREGLQRIQSLKLGFTHVGMEMFDTSMQPFFDGYMATGEGRNLLYAGMLSSFTGWYSDVAEDYMTIVDTAKDLGMRVIALNAPPSHIRSETIDIYMSHIIKAILEETPDHKIVTFTGTAHAHKKMHPGTYPTMAENLEKDGYPVVSVFLTRRNYPLS